MKLFMSIIQMIGFALLFAGVGSTLNAAFGWSIGLKSVGPFPKDYVSAAAFFILGGALAGLGYWYSKKNP